MYTYRSRFALLLAGAGVLLLHTWGIAGKALWYDEVTTAVYAGKSIAGLLRFLLDWDVHPPVFFMVEHYFAKLPLAPEWSLRLFPLFCSLLCIPVAESFIRRSYDVKWLGGAAAAVFPGLVIYGQEARAYAPLVLLQFSALYALQRLRENPGERKWIWLCVGSLWLAAAMSYFTILFLPVLVVALLLFTQKRGTAVLALVLAGVAYAPWLGRVLKTFGAHSEALQGAAPRILTGGDYFNTLGFHFGSPFALAIAIPLILVALWQTRTNRMTWILAALFLFTPIFLLLVPPRYPYFPPRYLISWAAVGLLLALPAAASPASPENRWIKLAPWLLIPVLLWPSIRLNLENRVWNRELGEQAASLFQEGDILVVEPYYQSLALLYYLPLAPATQSKLLANPLATYDGVTITLVGKHIGLTSFYALAPLLSNRGRFENTLYFLSYGPLPSPFNAWQGGFEPLRTWPQATLYKVTAPIRFDGESKKILLGTQVLGDWQQVAPKKLSK